MASNIEGRKFGRLTAVKCIGSERNMRVWECLCDCGKIVHRKACYLLSQQKTGTKISSCGCYKAERGRRFGDTSRTHGMSKNRLYHVHAQMIKRCTKPDHKDFSQWGGRGISVCAEWFDLKSFWEWACQSGYKDGLTIERIDNNGNYEPSNCTWIPNCQQGKNTRKNYFITYQGKTQDLTDWAKETGIKYTTIVGRKNLGWTPEQIFSVPAIHGRNQYDAK